MITIDEMKSWGTVPRVHPNGFIQIDKPEAGKCRVHIWTAGDELPKQGSQHPVHDHIFDMRSEVLMGEMTNLLFDFARDGDPTHELHRARYRVAHDSTLLPTGERGRLEVSSKVRVPAGSAYWMPAFVLHESRVAVRPTVTLMVATKIYLPAKPVVAVPVGMKVDNAYDRHTLPASQLWDIVESVIHV